MRKLTQKEVLANYAAMKAFMNGCEIEVDNGNMILFKAHGVYEDKTHGTSTAISRGSMSYGVDGFGGMSLSIGELDPQKQFNVFSTAFVIFRYANGILHITGKDTFGTGKGDYEIQLWG